MTFFLNASHPRNTMLALFHTIKKKDSNVSNLSIFSLLKGFQGGG